VQWIARQAFGCCKDTHRSTLYNVFVTADWSQIDNDRVRECACKILFLQSFEDTSRIGNSSLLDFIYKDTAKKADAKIDEKLGGDIVKTLGGNVRYSPERIMPVLNWPGFSRWLKTSTMRNQLFCSICTEEALALKMLEEFNIDLTDVDVRASIGGTSLNVINKVFDQESFVPTQGTINLACLSNLPVLAKLLAHPSLPKNPEYVLVAYNNYRMKEKQNDSEPSLKDAPCSRNPVEVKRCRNKVLCEEWLRNHFTEIKNSEKALTMFQLVVSDELKQEFQKFSQEKK
jgi:hypothetical protein